MTFADELRKAMTTRGVKPIEVYRPLGLAPSTVQNLLRGRTTASIPTAEAIAEHLRWPSLVTIAIRDRSGVCPIDGATFLRGARVGRKRKAYCSQRCQHVAHARRVREASRTIALTDTRITRQRLADHQEAVSLYCRTICEPEGLVCPDQTCPLACVTTLPRAMRSAA